MNAGVRAARTQEHAGGGSREEGGTGGHTGGRKGPVTKATLLWAVVWRSQSRALAGGGHSVWSGGVGLTS